MNRKAYGSMLTRGSLTARGSVSWRILLSTVLILLVLSLFSGGLPAVGTEVEDLKAELEDYKAQLSEVQARLDQTSSYHSDLLNELDTMNAQMYGLEADFSFYQGKMGDVTLNIEQISGSIVCAYRPANAHRFVPTSSAIALHSPRLMATPMSGGINRLFSARNRANSIRCQCS